MEDTIENTDLPTPEQISAVLKDRAAKGTTFQDVGDYTIAVPADIEPSEEARTLPSLFKPRAFLFPPDTSEN